MAVGFSSVMNESKPLSVTVRLCWQDGDVSESDFGEGERERERHTHTHTLRHIQSASAHINS